jgi:hypothetical protein
LGSYLVLGKLFCLVCFLAVAFGLSSSPPEKTGLLVVVPAIVAVWPLFLVVWLWRPSVRNYIRLHWCGRAVSGASH